MIEELPQNPIVNELMNVKIEIKINFSVLSTLSLNPKKMPVVLGLNLPF
jgi:hypothetical protein